MRLSPGFHGQGHFCVPDEHAVQLVLRNVLQSNNNERNMVKHGQKNLISELEIVLHFFCHNISLKYIFQNP